MSSSLQQLWRRRKPVAATALLVICSGLWLGAIRYTHRAPTVRTIDVKRGEFLDSLGIRGEVKALKSVGVTAPAEAGDLQILKIVSDGAKLNQGDPIVEFDKTKTDQDLAQYRSSLKYATADIEQGERHEHDLCLC